MPDAVTSTQITVEQLERAINRAKAAEPPTHCVLSPDVRALGELYGLMIFHQARVADLAACPEHTKAVLLRWLAP